MVKTKDVISQNNLSGSGAQISIEESTEKSPSIVGSTDWQQIEMIFIMIALLNLILIFLLNFKKYHK